MIRPFKNLWENFKEYIILILLILISFALLSQNQSSGIKKVRTLAFGSFAAVTSVFDGLFNIKGIRTENEKLRKVNAELMIQLSKLREYGIMQSQIEDMLNLKDTINYPYIPASIISKSLSRAQGNLTINVGAKEGVMPGMPVITSNGFAGIVSSASNDYSIVRTLQNVDLKLTVKCERTREHAILKWNGETLVMVNIPKTYQIKPGDRIVTSEISTIVPIPIPVGIVTDVGDVEKGIFNELRVKPFADFYNTEYVFVLGIISDKKIDGLELNLLNR